MCRSPACMQGLSSAFKPAGLPAFAPRNRFLAITSQRSSDHQQTSLKEAGNSERPFARPHRREPFGSCRGGVNAPGLSLRSLTPISPDPFGSDLLSPHRLACRGETQRPEPVTRFCRRDANFLRTSAPRQGLAPLPDRSAQSGSGSASLPRQRARLPFTPQKPLLGGRCYLWLIAPGSLRTARLTVE